MARLSPSPVAVIIQPGGQRGEGAGVIVPQATFFDLSTLDLVALACFIACWIGYTVFSDQMGERYGNLSATMARQREMWMTQMVGRDNRMVDLQVIRNLTRTGIFFASTSLLILAGLVTVLGATDQAIMLLVNIPYVARLTPFEWELRILLLIVMIIYSFFKFAWSVRQLSYCAIQVGGVEPATKATEETFARAKCIARLATLAAHHFNRGQRTYYFAMALLAWFVHPIALIVTSIWVVLVLYRREFHSRTLRILNEGLR